MSLKILHVEDSELDHEVFLRALPGVEVAWSKTTLDASNYLLSLKSSEHPSIIVMDLNLPVENGIKLIFRIKNNPRFIRIPIIVLSSITNQKEIDDCYKSGANAFIQKTLKSQDLNLKLSAFKEFWLHSVILPLHEDKK